MPLPRYNVHKLRGKYFVIDQWENRIVGTAHYGRGSAVSDMLERTNWDKQRDTASEGLLPFLDQIEELEHPVQRVEIVDRSKPSASRSTR